MSAEGDPDGDLDPGRPGRRLVLVQVGQFALAGAIALTIVGYATSLASRRVGQREATADARTTTVIKAQGVVEPALTDGMLHDPPDVGALDALAKVVRKEVIDRSLVRVKLWRPDGKIVYSDEPRLVGQSYALGDDELRAFVSGEIKAEVSDLSKPENTYERSYSKLLEVYLPVRTPNKQRLLFEAYYNSRLVEANGSRLWHEFAPITLGALLILELVQLPLAWSLSRRLRLRLRDRENLLRGVLRASDVERRQIASDLHDGAVQDLAGVAYALSAAARSGGAGPGVVAALESSAETVRGSIKALRSLVVDIYPPNFGEVPLESALADLLARASERGLATELVADPRVDELPDAVVRLLYRAAQEGVRNVLKHAAATRVTVTVGVEAGAGHLEVTDDGTGGGARSSPNRQGEHLGLTALAGLVGDAGGTLDLRPAPGGGTTLAVRVPV